MLLPPKPTSNLAKEVQRSRAEAGLEPAPTHAFWSETTASEPAEATPSGETLHPVALDLIRKRAWRVDKETLDRFDETLKKYQGTHCFHNYTVGREFSDRAAQRYMMRVEVRSVNVLEGVEWVSVLFHGQSFMLHQVRALNEPKRHLTYLET